MKKKVLLIAAIFTAGATFAQDALTSKKGVPILPEAGDYAISFDAGNLINYAGNLLNNSNSNSLNNLNLQNTMTIAGKYFVSSDKAYRGMVRLGFNDQTIAFGESGFNNTVINSANPLSPGDEIDVSSINVTIGGAIEMRRGNGRLQGYYGPVAMISFNTSDEEASFAGSPAAGDLVEVDFGTNLGIAAGGLAGVEFFFAPKISVGAEIMWTISYFTNGDVENTVFDGTNNNTSEISGGDGINVDTRPNGNISLNFHF